MKISYVPYKPQAESLALIELSNGILEDYTSQGFTLTLRQLYYQLVSRDEIPNTQASYDSLGRLIAKARDAGLVDWSHIVDRTRTVESYPHWDNGTDFIESVAPQYRHDLWDGQETRVFVFVEKQALEEVVSKPASQWDIPYFANKGYLSASSVWNVARNLMRFRGDCAHYVVLHLGDHDPSGIDMTRDIQDRLSLYSQRSVTVDVRRIALNMDQVEEHDPPPNPAKQTDSRFADYADKYGDESWELDALEPSTIIDLINKHVEGIVDLELWTERRELQNEIRQDILSRWSDD